MYSPNHVRDWYVKKKSKAIWKAFNSRSVRNNILDHPQDSYIYFQTNNENGYWLQNQTCRTSMEAVLDALTYNWCHRHITLYCVFSPSCKKNIARLLLEYLERRPKVLGKIKPTLTIYFSVICDFRINKPEDWFNDNEIAACILLRKITNQSHLLEFRPFGQDEWDFIASKLEIEFQYQKKSEEDIWDMKSFGDEEYSDLWNAMMEVSVTPMKLKELQLEIYSKTNFTASTARRHRLRRPRGYIESNLSIEIDELTDKIEKQKVHTSSKIKVVPFTAIKQNVDFDEERGTFCGQKGVEKRTRTIGRQEWKKISREATMSANVE